MPPTIPTTVICVPFELIRIAQGHPTRFRSTDGTDVEVRLATADEMLDMHRQACKQTGATPHLTAEQARAMTNPVNLTEIA